jgi:hypothetical protein
VQPASCVLCANHKKPLALLTAKATPCHSTHCCIAAQCQGSQRPCQRRLIQRLPAATVNSSCTSSHAPCTMVSTPKHHVSRHHTHAQLEAPTRTHHMSPLLPHGTCPHTRAISRDKEKPPLKHGMSTPVAREPSDTTSSHTRIRVCATSYGARDVNSAAACNLFGRCTKQTPSRTGNSTTYQQQLSPHEMNVCVLVCMQAERTPCTALGHTRHALPPLTPSL